MLDVLRTTIRAKHYGDRTEKTYVHWLRRFILFSNERHPREMGEAKVREFVTYLAVNGKVSASAQIQALSAILSRLTGTKWLIALLLYGAGRGLTECLRLRMKDLEFIRRQLVMPDGEGRKDRVAVLPDAHEDVLLTQVDHVRPLHARDVKLGYGEVPVATGAQGPGGRSRAGVGVHSTLNLPQPDLGR